MSSPTSPHIYEVSINNVAGDYFDHRRITQITSDGTKEALELRLQGALERLERHISRGAAHDSAERGPDAPKCAPETRKAIQEEILSWTGHGDRDANSTMILWLSGPAGTGKTTIAGSVADACQSRGWLAASFFFSAFVATSPDRRSHMCLIPTLAYHLVQQSSIPGLRDAMLASIATNPSVFEKCMEQQLELLILAPLRQVGDVVVRDDETWPKVVVIDSVDECDADLQKIFETTQERQQSRESNHREIISALAQASIDPAFPFRIIIASRPEPAISHSFASLPQQLAREIFLDDSYSPNADIELFTRTTLIKIGRDYGLRDDWFSPAAPRWIAEQASGQFIYAVTALRYVGDGTRPAQEQLNRIMDWRVVTGSSHPNPFASLDMLYQGILETSPDPVLAVTWIKARSIMDNIEGEFCRGICETFPGEAVFIFRRLSSLVGLVNSEGKPDLELYHKSLLDFLNDPQRSVVLYVSPERARQFTRDRFYQVLRGMSKFSRILVPLRYDPEVVNHTIGRRSQGEIGDTLPFLRDVCKHLYNYLDPHRTYGASDVDWWLSHITFQEEPGRQGFHSFAHSRIHLTYFNIHEEVSDVC